MRPPQGSTLAASFRPTVPDRHRSFDHIAAAGKNGAERRREALVEAHRNSIGKCCERLRVHAQRGCGIEQAAAVEMHADVPRGGFFAHAGHVVE